MSPPLFISKCRQTIIIILLSEDSFKNGVPPEQRGNTFTLLSTPSQKSGAKNIMH